MNIEQAKARLLHIKQSSADDELAHMLEDRFRDDVLKAIAGGSADSVELAKIALLTEAIEFARWCA